MGCSGTWYVVAAARRSAAGVTAACNGVRPMHICRIAWRLAWRRAWRAPSALRTTVGLNDTAKQRPQILAYCSCTSGHAAEGLGCGGGHQWCA